MDMDTITRPSVESKRHHTFRRHRSGSHLSKHSLLPSHIFEGTDAVLQKRKIALDRVIDTHHALELKYGHVATPTSTASDRPTSSSSSISYDPFTTDLGDLSIPDAEVRTFRYLLHRWEPRIEWADAEFDKAIERRRESFEEAAIKHFISRVALWDANEEEKQTQSRSAFSFLGRRRRSRAKSDASRMLSIAETAKEDAGLDALKEVTTREGLAQLLWTLLAKDEPATARLRKECKQALDEWYQVKIITDGSRDS
ncbi:hypothetical protein BKA58DRAFT_235397 [Alternaria rosae]|uniref:uncharacterized protein n=1 Tax=Alternaria rosae TaxID=1187941 RepID=UPI001E8DE39A|nr:uncharacterized protein BKA58DRAFT_235397 [Alternaria rosae]KAH6864929.1 hypothetical protein BKA58DRAFT_235397 [Alternaria rosae]